MLDIPSPRLKALVRLSHSLKSKSILHSSLTELLFLFLFVSQGNKGGVSVRLSFYGHTLCFLNCHLAAHMKFATERVDEFEYIMDTQTFDCKKAQRIVDHR